MVVIVLSVTVLCRKSAPQPTGWFIPARMFSPHTTVGHLLIEDMGFLRRFAAHALSDVVANTIMIRSLVGLREVEPFFADNVTATMSFTIEVGAWSLANWPRQRPHPPPPPRPHSRCYVCDIACALTPHQGATSAVGALVADQFGRVTTAVLKVGVTTLTKIDPAAFRGVSVSSSVTLENLNSITTLSETEPNSIAFTAFACATFEDGSALTMARSSGLTCPGSTVEVTKYVACGSAQLRTSVRTHSFRGTPQPFATHAERQP